MRKRFGRPEKGFAEHQKKEILRILTKASIDMTEAEIAGQIGVTRLTAHKYLQELLKERKIRINRKLGKYTFYTIKK